MTDKNPSPPNPDDPPSDGSEPASPAGAATEEDSPHPLGLDDVEVRDLLRSALAAPGGSTAPRLLRGVQKKLRKRSRGKFYGDGWSIARSPRGTYLVTSLLMLTLVGFVYLVLIPWAGSVH